MFLKDTIEIIQFENDPLFDEPSTNISAQTNLKILVNPNPSMILNFLYLPNLHLKAMCANGYINKFLKLFINDFKNLENLKYLEHQINSNSRLFGTSVEQISQALCMAFPIHIAPSSHFKKDNWTTPEQCLFKIECSFENYFKLYITLELDDHNLLNSINKKLLKEIKKVNSMYFGKDLKNYHITPIKNGFCINYNIFLAFAILHFSDQIHEHFEEVNGFILKI